MTCANFPELRRALTQQCSSAVLPEQQFASCKGLSWWRLEPMLVSFINVLIVESPLSLPSCCLGIAPVANDVLINKLLGYLTQRIKYSNQFVGSCNTFKLT